MARITIDGQEVDAQDGLNVIEAAKLAEVHVPHFCYHPALSVVGQCRMCLVEIEGMPKLQAGCSTQIRDGMKIWVHNEKVEKARKGQMEFLLINHPLDCPICDKAGECPLQDYSFNYGMVTSRYGEVKRTYPGMDRTAIGPHVFQNMNRCIHCTRCIRFCDEITGTSELAFFKRGAETEVGIFPGRPIENWMSACVTDVCPTGALTTREFRFEQRVWNLDSTESVCNGCDVGCNLFVEHKGGQIYRYKPRLNPDVNDFWLCDYGRFSHERFETDRVVVPRLRIDDRLGISGWPEVWDELLPKLSSTPGERIGVIASAQLTNEEAWLLAKIFVERLGSPHVDVVVDAIGPIPMKSRTGWLEGTQGGPNLRGIRAMGIRPTGRGAEGLMNEGADGLDLLYIADASFGDRSRDPRVVANLRKAGTLVVHAWEGGHPLVEAADIVLPSSIFAEKAGSWTNLQGRVQRIHQAFLPKGEALTDWEILRRIGERLFPGAAEFEARTPEDTFSEIARSVPSLEGLRWNEAEGFGIIPGASTALEGAEENPG
ncbi:MAG TPA: molybdopterin-dependent oxidoreductase [Thermoanaerobaculia bacterium]|nr:molybdopterin-dependent oxidoreductase [Thermoanaerobaculia bacterium]